MGDVGYIKLYRQLQDCWVWDDGEPFTRGQAWIDLLMMANHEDHKTVFDGKMVVVRRGQRITSVRKLSERWHWGKDKVLTFLKLLERDQMISRDADSRRTLLTIVNYEKFQGFDSEEQTVNRQSADSEQTVSRHSPATNNNENNEKKEKKKENARAREETPVQVEAPVELIPLADSSGWRPTVDEYEEYHRLFPDVDIDAEFRKMRAWCLSNSLKTRRGVKRFVNGWLSRAQDRPKPKPKTERAFNADEWLLNQIRGDPPC